MGREYRQIGTKNEIHFNIFAWTYIDKICTGLYEKLGLTYPISSEDCKIIARIIRNYNIYQGYGCSAKEMFKVDSLKEETIKFMEKIAKFFETAKNGVEELR